MLKSLTLLTHLALALSLWCSQGYAASPNKPTAATAPKKPKSLKRSPNRREYNFLPGVNYSTERGFGFGVTGSIAQFREGIEPYHWRLFFRLFATVILDDNNQAVFPFHHDAVSLDLRGLAQNKVRLLLRAGFFRFSTTGYFGLGNASKRDPKRASTYYQYDRTYPTAYAGLFTEIWRKGKQRLEVHTSLALMHNSIVLNPGSQIQEELRRSLQPNDDTSQKLNEMMRGLRPHTQIKAVVGLIYDSRNHEFSPQRGMFHELTLRAILPGLAPGLAFAAGHINLRFFAPLWKNYLVLAVRLMGDMIWGSPPIYELYTLGGTRNLDGPGGLNTIRGIRAQRYYGKIKVVGNLELRSVIFDFHLWKQHLRLGLLLFVDSGRVWLDYTYPNEATRAAFDGNELGFTAAIGGGGRLQWGETFILRADFGWSPTDQDLGFYIWVGHLF